MANPTDEELVQQVEAEGGAIAAASHALSHFGAFLSNLHRADADIDTTVRLETFARAPFPWPEE